MIGVMLQVAAGGFSSLLSELEALGFFQYVLPFLLIFAVIYAILTKIHVFEDNKGAAVVVALAAGLLSLQFDKVPAFFQAIFPSFGIGIAILLAALVLAGAFISDETAYKWIFFGIGAFIFLVVVLASLSEEQFVGNYWWQDYKVQVISIFAIAGVIVGIIVAGRKKKG